MYACALAVSDPLSSARVFARSISGSAVVLLPTWMPADESSASLSGPRAPAVGDLELLLRVSLPLGEPATPPGDGVEHLEGQDLALVALGDLEHLTRSSRG